MRLVMGIGRAEKFAMGAFETLPHRATERGVCTRITGVVEITQKGGKITVF